MPLAWGLPLRGGVEFVTGRWVHWRAKRVGAVSPRSQCGLLSHEANSRAGSTGPDRLRVPAAGRLPALACVQYADGRILRDQVRMPRAPVSGRGDRRRRPQQHHAAGRPATGPRSRSRKDDHDCQAVCVRTTPPYRLERQALVTVLLPPPTSLAPPRPAAYAASSSSSFDRASAAGTPRRCGAGEGDSRVALIALWLRETGAAPCAC